jgi:hypothetical protein
MLAKRLLVFGFLLLAGAALGQPVTSPPSSIGVASMAGDGVITLRLRAEDHGMVGEGLLTYRPGDAQYEEVVRHLGGLKPGQVKPVPPWPDK